MRVLTIQIRVPDDVEIQVNRSDEPSHMAEPPFFEGQPEPVAIPLCPRHKKSKADRGGYYCPTPISPVGVEPKVWCDWHVTS